MKKKDPLNRREVNRKTRNVHLNLFEAAKLLLPELADLSPAEQKTLKIVSNQTDVEINWVETEQIGIDEKPKSIPANTAAEKKTKKPTK